MSTLSLKNALSSHGLVEPMTSAVTDGVVLSGGNSAICGMMCASCIIGFMIV